MLRELWLLGENPCLLHSLLCDINIMEGLWGPCHPDLQGLSVYRLGTSA